jgi:hypothetical protein
MEPPVGIYTDGLAGKCFKVAWLMNGLEEGKKAYSEVRYCH